MENILDGIIQFLSMLMLPNQIVGVVPAHPLAVQPLSTLIGRKKEQNTFGNVDFSIYLQQISLIWRTGALAEADVDKVWNKRAIAIGSRRPYRTKCPLATAYWLSYRNTHNNQIIVFLPRYVSLSSIRHLYAQNRSHYTLSAPFKWDAPTKLSCHFGLHEMNVFIQHV